MRLFPGTLQQYQEQTGQQQREHLWPHTPTRHGRQSTANGYKPGNVGVGSRAPVGQQKARGHDQGEYSYQGPFACETKNSVEDDFGEPFMGDPRLARARLGERIDVGNSSCSNDQLPGTEMPPEVRIREVADRQCE